MKRYDWIRLSATLNEAQNNHCTKLVLEDFSFGRGTMRHLVDFLQRQITSERSIIPCQNYHVNSLYFENCIISQGERGGSLSILCNYFSSLSFSSSFLQEVSIADCILGNENAALLLGSMSPSTMSTSSTSFLKVLRLTNVEMNGVEAGRIFGTVLKQNPQLQTLEVSGCSLGREGIHSLQLALTTTSATLSATTVSSTAATATVATGTGTITSTITLDLRRLSLSKCDIGNDGLQELLLLDFTNFMPFLKNIELRRNNFSGQIGGRLLHDLVQNMLVAATTAAAAPNVNDNDNELLLSIDFGGNPLGCAGLTALGPALMATGNRLKSLILDDCCGGVAVVDGDGDSLVAALEYLRTCLQHCSMSLVQLNLADNGIALGRRRRDGTQLQCIQVFERLLRHHNNGILKNIDLSSNPLGMGALILAPAIRNHDEWDLLNLQLCNLGDMGVTILVEHGLIGHNGLKCINLSRNQCTGASLPCLTMFLNETPNLQELVLFSNDIFQINNNNVVDNNTNNINFEPVKMEFLEAIANHKTLRAIDLRNTYNTATTIHRTVLNDVNDPSVAIADYLVLALQEKNTSLDTVHIDANRDQRKLIDSYGKRNKLLKQVQPLLLEASTSDRSSDGNGHRWFLALEQCSQHEEGTNASYKVLHKMVEHGFFQGDTVKVFFR